MAHRNGAVYTRYRCPVVAFMHFHVQFSGLIHYFGLRKKHAKHQATLYTNVYTEKEGRKIYSSLAASKADRME